MLSYEIIDVSPNFPEMVTGVVLTDDGSISGSFHRSLRKVVNKDEQLIPLFLSEFAVTDDVLKIQELNQAGRLACVATFGVLDSLSHTEIGTSHFAIIARELGIHFVQLELPSEYKQRSIFDWAKESPLKSVSNELVTLTKNHDLNTVSFNP